MSITSDMVCGSAVSVVKTGSVAGCHFETKWAKGD